jgi:fermentation-respiration switch protein FrsA (DUF1100 family)
VRHRLLRAVVALSYAYLGVLLVLLSLENRFLFHPTTAAESWEAPPPGLAVEDVEVTAADGNRVHMWWSQPPGWTPEKGALLYCHGNAGNLSHRGPQLIRFQQALGVATLIFDYPGYGKSGGRPSEAGLYASGEAAYRWLTEKRGVAGEKVILYGGSLGGAVALELATRHPHRAVVTVAAFTSFPDMASLRFPWLPVRWLVRNRLDNLKKIATLDTPAFLAHGTADRLVPFTQGQRLFAAAKGPKRFFPMEGYDHNHTPGPDFYVELKRFLDGPR